MESLIIIVDCSKLDYVMLHKFSGPIKLSCAMYLCLLRELLSSSLAECDNSMHFESYPSAGILSLTISHD